MKLRVACSKDESTCGQAPNSGIAYIAISIEFPLLVSLIPVLNIRRTVCAALVIRSFTALEQCGLEYEISTKVGGKASPNISDQRQKWSRRINWHLYEQLYFFK